MSYRRAGMGDAAIVPVASTITPVLNTAPGVTSSNVVQLALMAPGQLVCGLAPSLCSSVVAATGGNPANGQMVIGGAIWAVALYLIFGRGGGSPRRYAR